MKQRSSLDRRVGLSLIAAAVLGGIFIAIHTEAAIVNVTSNIATSTTWTGNNTYYIEDAISVDASATLTIASGTVIKFATSTGGSGLSFYVDGILQVNGTSTKKVYFTSANDNSVGSTTAGSSGSPAAGDWGDIEIFSGASSTIQGAVLRYGGSILGGNSSDLSTTGGTTTISNSIIATSSNYGVYANGGTVSITSTTFNNDEQYGLFGTGSSTLTIASDSFLQNTNGAVLINYGSGITFTPSNDIASGTDAGFSVNGTTIATTTWYQDLPYISDGSLGVSSTLIVNPGTIVKIIGYLGTENGGSLDVQGTTANPVYFTSINDNSVGGDTSGSSTSTPAPGDWESIDIGSTATSTFNNAIIRYGGGTDLPFASIYVQGGNVSLNHSTVTLSNDNDIYIDSGSAAISSSTISSSSYGIFVNGGTINVNDSSIINDPSDGVYNGTEVTSSAYAVDNYWGSASGPYNANSNPGGSSSTPVSDYVNFLPFLTQSPINPTTTISLLEQYKSDATTTLSEGSSTTESVIVFGAKLQSTATASESLEVEVEPTGTAFTNTVTVSSTYVAPGNSATATYPLADTRESSGNGSFHWQARAIDAQGDVSPWQSFGPSPSSTDFVIDTIPLYTQVTSTYPSLASTTSWATAPYDDALPGTGCGQSTSTIGTCGCLLTATVQILRSYGITKNVSGTDVNPLTLNNWLASTTGGFDGQGNMNLSDVPNYAETASGTFRITYNSSQDHISSASTTWVNKWLNNLVYATGTVPVMLTAVVPLAGGGGATTTHFIVATGFVVDPLNQATSTYTVRDPYFYNTAYFNEATSTEIHNYANTYSGATVLLPTSTTILPLYLEYDIDSAHTLLITDPNGRRLGIDPATGMAFSEIPNGNENDDEAGSRFLTVDNPIAGQYTITVGGVGIYKLYSYAGDGKHAPVPQIISSSTPSTAVTIYHESYDPNDSAAGTLQ